MAVDLAVLLYKNEIDTRCLLCAKEEENIEHFILNCKILSKVRNTILQELITPFNTLGIEFDELSANEKLQHILDIPPVVKTKKLSPASVVEIERPTRKVFGVNNVKYSIHTKMSFYFKDKTCIISRKSWLWLLLLTVNNIVYSH
jgi:hypothetical protein